MLFALSARARDALIEQFKAHAVRRVYVAVVHRALRDALTMDTMLVRDRGDGLRGSVPPGVAAPPDAQRAVTHVRPIEQIEGGDGSSGSGAYSVVECRLETGRTHQIRIHLAETGHMVCGEKLYVRPRANAEAVVDRSGAPRQALHARQLTLVHPIGGHSLEFESPLPRDLAVWLDRLRSTARR
jgi:23S rRNA pseudouridine1911/1915/1917 synthase